MYLVNADNWVEVGRFKGGNGGLVVSEEHFTCDYGEWRIKWEFSLSKFSSAFLPQQYTLTVVTYREGEEDHLVAPRIYEMANGTRSGTSYVHDSYGRYYMLIRSTDLESYTITIEQNTEYVPEPQPEIMSFEEAIDAAETNNYSGSTLSYALTGEPEGDLFTDGNGISGFLMWLAPNGTLYEVEYPSGDPSGEIGHTFAESSWNPPEGYYLWWLDFSEGEGETFWVLAENGTIVEHYFGRGEGPSPTPQPFPTEFAYAITAAAAVATLVSVTVLLYFKKRKR